MSRKSNRLKNRLRIEKERSEKELKRLLGEARLQQKERIRLDAMRQTIEEAKKDLNRSVALRVRVNRDFDRPIGNVWALNIAFWPEEFRFQFYRSGDRDRFQDATHYAYMRGREIGEQIAKVIARCLTGELKEFEKAS